VDKLWTSKCGQTAVNTYIKESQIHTEPHRRLVQTIRGHAEDDHTCEADHLPSGCTGSQA
jgi:hypothetical protein